MYGLNKIVWVKYDNFKVKNKNTKVGIMWTKNKVEN